MVLRYLDKKEPPCSSSLEKFLIIIVISYIEQLLLALNTLIPPHSLFQNSIWCPPLKVNRMCSWSASIPFFFKSSFRSRITRFAAFFIKYWRENRVALDARMNRPYVTHTPVPDYVSQLGYSWQESFSYRTQRL